MDPLLAVIIVLGVALLVVSAYMEVLGLSSILSAHDGTRHPGCGHRRLTPGNSDDVCWHCRHQRLERALHIARH